MERNTQMSSISLKANEAFKQTAHLGRNVIVLMLLCVLIGLILDSAIRLAAHQC